MLPPRASHLSSPLITQRIERFSFVTILAGRQQSENHMNGLLAADRVYLLVLSPGPTVGFYPTRFTLTPLYNEAVSFLWHFP